MEKKKVIVVQRGSLVPALPEGRESEDEELARLCRLLHIASQRDTEGTVVQVVRILVEKGREPVGSSDLSKETGINRVTVLHHLKRLAEAGVVEKRESQYMFAYDNFEDMVQMMREETVRMFEEMEQIAKKIDDDFNLVEEYGQEHRVEIGQAGEAKPGKRKIRRAGEE